MNHPGVAVVFIILGIYLVGFWAPRRLRKAKKANLQKPSTKSSEKTATTSYIETKVASEKLMVELHEMGRSLSVNLETKIVQLKELISQADQRIKTLESLNEKPGEFSETVKEDIEEPVELSRHKKLQEKNIDVFEYLQQGLTHEEISEKTGKPIGEIQLLVGLQSKKTDESRES